MRRLGLVLGATTLLAAGASCSDQRIPTGTDARTFSPSGVSRAVLSVTGAVFTSTDPNDDTDPTNSHDLCQNSKDASAPAINCNIYFSKDFVWLSGGPGPSDLADGTYFFAVLVPGGQNNSPNDGGDLNLSDATADLPAGTAGAGDSYLNRVFTVSGGVISYAGSHGYDATRHMIRLMPYDNTTNPGGEYDMAVCQLGAPVVDGNNVVTGYDGYPADPSQCKYDNFKVDETKPCPNPLAEDCQFHTSATLSIEKTLTTTWNRPYTWTINKAVDKTKVSKENGTATFNYTVGVKPTAGTDAFSYSGTVVVTNTSNETATNVVITDATVTLSCTPAASPTTLAPGASISCTFSVDPASAGTSVTNTARVDWNTVDANGEPITPFAEDSRTVAYTMNAIDECVTVSDVFNGQSADQAHSYCVGDAGAVDGTYSFTYSRTVPIPSSGCTTYNNTATYTTNDTPLTGSASKSVQACRIPAASGAHTMGFWQNKNGQGIITAGASTAGVCNSGTYLKGFAPFANMTATTCAQVAAYVTGIIKAANASGAAMNAMLKGQMLATALSVYFGGGGGGNPLNAPAPIGGLNIDLTLICKMIYDVNGNATCSGAFSNTSSAFGGAASLTVNQLLAYAASQSNVGGSVWYGQVKATQELAKNTFDAINNQVAFVNP
jgi:hypothetical protein